MVAQGDDLLTQIPLVVRQVAGGKGDPFLGDDSRKPDADVEALLGLQGLRVRPGTPDQHRLVASSIEQKDLACVGPNSHPQNIEGVVDTLGKPADVRDERDSPKYSEVVRAKWRLWVSVSHVLESRVRGYSDYWNVLLEPTLPGALAKLWGMAAPSRRSSSRGASGVTGEISLFQGRAEGDVLVRSSRPSVD
jgi:hypothetical protein